MSTDTVLTSPWRYLGFTIWPVLDDETGEVDYFDVMGPCRDRTHADRDIRCDCPIGLDAEAMCGTVEEARETVRRLASERRSWRRALGDDPWVRL